ncbi:MAG: NTP transferase domain-containing protein [Phycisphaerales bacterium]|nr:NTP transferase domain-containing protein [Phycisphaerales bacterium]
MIATKRGPRRPAALCGVILAGGHRWGGNELESIIPRALLPIAGSPLAAYALRTLRAAGIREIIICATSATLAIARAFGDGSDFDLDWGGTFVSGTE